MDIPKRLPLWINGEEVYTDNTFQTLDPYTGSVLSEVSIPEEKHINNCLGYAQQAQREWSKKSASERSQILSRSAQLLKENNDVIARIESCDTGRVIGETEVVDIVSAAECLEYYAGLIEKFPSRFVELENGDHIYALRRPLGVCLGIGAWNYPIQIAAWKSAPALAAGNAMIFKPSEQTPITAIMLAKIYKEAGLPDGLFNIIHGEGSVAKKLIESPIVKKVSLTGSVETGKKVYQSCASQFKKVSLELGGKSPIIIFNDADFDKAVEVSLWANFYSSGQICSNGTRVFVHQDIVKRFEQVLLEKANNLKLGNPLEKESQIGPLINGAHKEKVLNYIDIAKREGARLLTTEKSLNGNFVSPTIFTDCLDEMTHCREEIFGPVMSILSFENEDEVIARANNSEFGLAGGVFTRDLNRGHRVAESLEAGVCWINNYNLTPIDMPFGGTKMSGIGCENGLEGLLEYTRNQSVYIDNQ